MEMQAKPQQRLRVLAAFRVRSFLDQTLIFTSPADSLPEVSALI